MMTEKSYGQMKGDEKRYRSEDAARTLKQYAKINKDKVLLAAAREVLKMEIKLSQEAVK